MGFQLWSQSNFTKGELSPYMYARSDTQPYFNGLKTAQNVLTYPTGAAGKRFGTLYQTTFSAVTSSSGIYFQTFQYANECTYQLIFYPDNIGIYLEGTLVFTVTSTGLNEEAINGIVNTVLNTAFRITGQLLTPHDLTRSSDSGNVIASVASNQWTLTTPFGTAGQVLPVQVGNSGGALPTTVPQINAGVTYFIKVINTTTVQLYPTSYDAKFGTNAYTLVDNGSGTNTMYVLNTWTYAATKFKNLPVFDFDGGYDSVTFTPSATSGNAVTITVSAGITPAITSRFVGGAFIGNGGVSRITAVASGTSFTVAVQTPFNNTSAILGSLAFLAEPAWSDARGWPQKCSSYQNRALFANTVSLPNGFWASAINGYDDFDDLQTDDDNAISWYPTSDDINFIRFIVPYRSITVHTNSGIYSSPLSDVNAITPSNFSLQLQDSTPADVLQPRAIDNQIIVISGDDVHTMLWDGINNAYTSDIVSVPSEQLIRSPVDEGAFADLHRAGSRYVFIINANGSMAMYQTLISQQVGGFTPGIMEQSYGSAYFRQLATNADGRCWFFVERQIASAQAGVAISGFTSSTLTANGTNFDTSIPTAITFTTGGSLPACSTVTLDTSTYYYAIGVDANTFNVYASQADALAGTNQFVFTSDGTGSFVVAWPLTTIFTMEELTQDARLDCAVYYNGTATDTVSTGALFNGQSVKMVGDGYGFDAVGFNDEVVFESHGSTQQVSEAYIGFPINLIIEPMPITMPSNYNSAPSVLPRPKHIRFVQFMFNNTIGGSVNGIPIALNRFDSSGIGDPPVPARGLFEIGVMKGWDDFNNPSFTITHSEPFNIELLGVFYGLDI